MLWKVLIKLRMDPTSKFFLSPLSYSPPKKERAKEWIQHGKFYFFEIKPKPMLAQVLLGFPNVWD
jgi:hypothetical protein